MLVGRRLKLKAVTRIAETMLRNTPQTHSGLKMREASWLSDLFRALLLCHWTVALMGRVAALA